MTSSDERGFTLPELIVVTVFVLVMLVVSTFFLLAPADYQPEQNDARRRTDIASMAQAIQRYKADNGAFPPDIPSELTAIGSPEDHYNLCVFLVPTYMKDLPLDPGVGIKSKKNNDVKVDADPQCSDEGIEHAIGYAIMQKQNGDVVVSAPLTDVDKVIEITIR